jgi:Transcriptional regulators
MQREDSVTRELKILMNKIHRKAHSLVPDDVRRLVTPIQFEVMKFLYGSRERDVYQKDVEAEFSVTRATASKMLSLMERNGLITRTGVAGDARLKKLALTEKSEALSLRMRQGMEEFEQNLTRGLSASERETLLRLLKKLEQNAE